MDTTSLTPLCNHANVSDDLTLVDPNHHVVWSLDGPYIVLEVLIGVVAVIGNCLVILVFAQYECLRTVTNYYVISLSAADLLVGLVGIPSAIATSVGYPQNFEACLLMNSILLLLCTGSIFSLVAITMDRFWAIIFPFTYSTRMTLRTAKIALSVSWTMATVVGLLPVMGWNLGKPPEPRCFFMEVIDTRYLVFVFFATILAPSVFLAVVYVRIYQAVQYQLRRMTEQRALGQTESHVCSKTERRAAQSVAIIVALFVISWIPLYTLNTVVCFCRTCYIPEYVFNVAIILSHVNSAWNPCLYAWGMRDFRTCLKKLFKL